MTSVEQFLVAECTLDGAIVGDHGSDCDEHLPQENDVIRVTRDIPDLALRRGDMGIVRSRWLAPALAYEIEFHFFGSDLAGRGLLMPEQIEVIERRPRALPEIAEGESQYDDDYPLIYSGSEAGT